MGRNQGGARTEVPMNKYVLWLWAESPGQDVFHKLGTEISVIPFSDPVKISLNPNRFNAFCVEQSFFNRYPGALTLLKPEPGSVLVLDSAGEGGYLTPEKIEKYVFRQFRAFEAAELPMCLKGLYRGLVLQRKLELTRSELKQAEGEKEELLQIGVALSAEQDNDKLLRMILSITRKITRADAGSLYRVIENKDCEGKRLLFKIAQNDSNETNYCEFEMPLNKKSISGWVAATGEVLNIHDVYKIPADKEYTFNEKFDRDTSYRTVSMLTVPMVDHKGEIIGVIQLINRRKPGIDNLCQVQDYKKAVMPFSRKNEQLVLSLASQAAVSLENNLLYQEIETLFEGFVMASVKAIEARDPSTSGHSYRVAVYTVALARAVDRIDEGRFKEISFSREQLKEIRYASLLHDFGKVGVREQILVKSKKLYPAQMDLIRQRCEFIIQSLFLDLHRRKYEFAVQGRNSPGEMQALEEELVGQVNEVKHYLRTILQANEPAILNEEPSEILERVKDYTFYGLDKQMHHLLSPDEYNKLKIVRGSLDEKERLEIESHVTHTYQFLSQIPWTKEMKDIPVIAYGHHEKLNGDGYPRGIQSHQIPLQSKIMAVSDIYDALTARDRPYKPAVSMQKALQILQYEVQDNHVDGDLVKIFIEAGICRRKDELLDKI